MTLAPPNRARCVHAGEHLPVHLSHAQVLVNALVSLMESTPPTHTTPTGAPSPTAPRTATLDFITSLVTARRVTVQPQFVILLLEHVINPPPGSAVLELPAAQPPRPPAPANMAGGMAGEGEGAWEVCVSGPCERVALCLIEVVGVNPLSAVRQATDRLSPQVRSHM